MKSTVIIIVCFVGVLLKSSSLSAFEVEPRISDREIVERLTRLEEGQKNIEKRIDDVNNSLSKRMDDLRSEMNSRFNILQWMLGIFISIAIIIFGFVLRMQWQMQKRQTIMETTLEAQKASPR